MEIQREAQQTVKHLWEKFPIVSLTGPRQSGKTTLAKQTFPKLPYVNLEDFVLREHVKTDISGFLKQYPQGLIIDEAQNLPQLFSALQVITDERKLPGQYLITGSQDFLLNERITQSLAGRVGIIRLLPLTFEELQQTSALPINQALFQGGYPGLYRMEMKPQEFFSNYLQTYVERDVRTLKNVEDLDTFQKFILLCAGRVGQLLNLSTLSRDVGVSVGTVKAWLSVLKASYVVYTLPPLEINVNKQMTRSPKLYFYDTGLLCYLLNIQKAEWLSQHYTYGALFENFVLNELLKQPCNQGKRPSLFFLRDAHGHEVDAVLSQGSQRQLLEIKATASFHKDFIKGIAYFQRKEDTGTVIYQGDIALEYKGISIVPTREFLNGNKTFSSNTRMYKSMQKQRWV